VARSLCAGAGQLQGDAATLMGPLAGTFHPLTDGRLADAQCLGHLALRPALLLELPGLQPSAFFPVVRWRVHTWQGTTASCRS
jgi:hypothetical protein